MTHPPQRIGVIGSLNVDYVLQLKSIPKPGESVAAKSFQKFFGGKGANQAVAARRMGAEVVMVGAIGDDADGTAYAEHLTREGMDTSHLLLKQGVHTGMAYITVDDSAENCIVVAAGANGHIDANDLPAIEATWEGLDSLLLQFEITESILVQILERAAARHLPVVLNPSPWSETFPWGKSPLHTVIVNEHEVGLLLGQPLESSDRPFILDRLATLQIANLVVTRGGDSTLFYSQDLCLEVPAKKVVPIDTVGAGDTFAGAYTSHLHLPPLERLQLSNAAGALATTKAGAQTGMPTLDEVKAWM